MFTLDDVGQIDEVLLPSRLVETELMHQLGMAFRGYAALAGQASHRIARQQPDKGEGHQGDADEGRYELGQPGDAEAEHGTGAWAGSQAEGACAPPRRHAFPAFRLTPRRQKQEK